MIHIIVSIVTTKSMCNRVETNHNNSSNHSAHASINIPCIQVNNSRLRDKWHTGKNRFCLERIKIVCRKSINVDDYKKTKSRGHLLEETTDSHRRSGCQVCK